MSLHYLVKLEMLDKHVLLPELLQKDTTAFITPRLWPANSPDLNAFAYSVWRILQQKMYKILTTDLDELK